MGLLQDALTWLVSELDDIGLFDQSIILEAPVISGRDALGGPVETFSTATTVAASVTAKSGMETREGAQVVARERYIIRIQALDATDITPDHRIRWNAKTLNIESITTNDRYWTIIAMETL